MTHPTLSGESGRMFMESLYHVATCDGDNPQSKDALSTLIVSASMEFSFDELGKSALDYAVAARKLDSTWLRRLLLQACALVAQMNGEASVGQREAIKDLAQALGLTEEAALAELDAHAGTDMTLAQWLEHLEVDYLSWDSFAQAGCFWRFPHTDISISEQANLRVHEGQALLVRYQGEWTDLLMAGNYLVLPQTLPGYAQRSGWAKGPMKAEFYFVRTSAIGPLRWGLSDGVELGTRDGQRFSLKAFGKCSVAFANIPAIAQRFLRLETPDKKATELRLGRIIAGRFAESLRMIAAAPDADVLSLLSDMDQLRDTLAPLIRDAIAPSGLSLHRFEIENINVPDGLGVRATSARSKALNRAGSQIMGGRSTNLLLESCETGVLESMDGDSLGSSFEDSQASDTAFDVPSTGGE